MTGKKKEKIHSFRRFIPNMDNYCLIYVKHVFIPYLSYIQNCRSRRVSGVCKDNNATGQRHTVELYIHFRWSSNENIQNMNMIFTLLLPFCP